MPGLTRALRGNSKTNSKVLQFADIVAIRENQKELNDSKRKKAASSLDKNLQNNSNRSITQRTFSSIDRHITEQRQHYNENKATLTKLDKITYKAAEQVTGIDKAKYERAALPIK